MRLPDKVDWTDFNLQVALFLIILNPIYWNIVGWLNYKTKFLEKLLFGPQNACNFLALTIMILGSLRSWYFKMSLLTQPSSPPLLSSATPYIATFFIVFGSTLVVTSFFTLGYYGTFLGEYFGIKIPNRVKSFPFNVFNSPNYFGSTLNFLGTALLYNSEAGIFLTLVVATMYSGVSLFEEYIKRMIYKNWKKSNKSA